MHRFAIIVITLISSLHSVLLAQQPFEFIYHDAEDKRDSIIDFGATLPGTQLYKTVVIKNVSNQTIWLETSTIEWYSIQLDPSNTISGTFREYGGPYRYPITPVATGFFDNGEVILPPGASDTMLIRFNSDTVGDQQMTGRKTGFLDLIVRRYPFKDRTNEIAKRRFFLTTIKTKKLLAVRRDTVHFDSVYVGTTAFEDWSVLNASRLSVDAHQLYPASSEFLVPQPIANIPPGPSFDFPVRINYTPTNRGSDEAEVAAEYTLPGGIEKDTVRSIIKGFGAEQQLNVSAARMNALPIHIIDNVLTPDAGDTIYIGDVRVGRNIEIELDIVNVGNINFQAVKDTILLSGRADYSIEQPFFKTPLTIAQTRSVLFHLKPMQMGNITATYVIESDIAGRVSNAPEHARHRALVIRMRGIEPKLTAAAAIGFDELEVLKDCQRSETKIISIINTGNIPLKIESATLEAGSPNFTLQTPVNQPFEIDEGEDHNFILAFAPQIKGPHYDTLVIISNIDGGVTRIPVAGVGIDPFDVVLAMPAEINIRPGTRVRIPVTATSGMLQRASKFETKIDFNESVLKPYSPEFIAIQNTAAVGSNVEYDPLTNILKIISASGFSVGDTLAFLQFDSFLGNEIESFISMPSQSVKLGFGECPAVFKTITAPKTRVVLDSACGLYYKVGVGSGRFNFQSAYPTPARMHSSIDYEVAYPTQVYITLYDSYGRIVSQPVKEEQSAGAYHITIPTSNLIPGMYFCEMRAGLFQSVQHIIVVE